MSEKDIEKIIQSDLSKYFEFIPKVKGKHFSGKTLEIDFIIKPIDNSLWKKQDIVFGLEFKDLDRFDKKGDTTDFTKWIAQCVDYSNTDWNNYGYINILTCPGISTSTFMEAAYSSSFVLRILGHLGVGELKNTTNYGWAIFLHEQHRMWSEKEGVSSGKNWNLSRKFGSR
ncbi:MAG: hypothetical protein JNM88_06965 [Chitinophagaceae bacterium]|jgi:hypothetical protein|nr:hypothetical protein [Chitinophagaceae bacterium]